MIDDTLSFKKKTTWQHQGKTYAEAKRLIKRYICIKENVRFENRRQIDVKGALRRKYVYH